MNSKKPQLSCPNPQQSQETLVVVYKSGKPVAAVVPIPNADDETVALSTSRKFLKIIERSRTRVKAEGAIPAGELRRRLGLMK